MGSNPNKLRLRLEALENRYVFSVSMFGDLDPWGMERQGQYAPVEFVKSGSNLYFRGSDAEHGIELWKTDESGSGKSLVKDLREGPAHSYPLSLVDLNGTLLFYRLDFDADMDSLWKSDGTESGTVMIKAFASDHGASSIGNFLVVEDQLLFLANDGTNHRALWTTDGSVEGTIMVQDAAAGTLGARIRSEVATNGFAYFVSTKKSGLELWRTDLTSANTTLLSSVYRPKPGTRFGYEFFDFSGSVVNTEGSNTDSSTAGVVSPENSLVAASVGVIDLQHPAPIGLTNADGRLFYFYENASGYGLYIRDETDASFRLVTSVDPGRYLWNFRPPHFATIGRSIIFPADDGIHGAELWVSDGTAEGTRMLRDIHVGAAGSALYTGWLVDAEIGPDGRLYFLANDGINGAAIWATDGTPDGTALFADVSPDTTSRQPVYGFSSLTSGLYFMVIDDGFNPGTSLWRIENVSAGPKRICTLDVQTSDFKDYNVQLMQYTNFRLASTSNLEFFIDENAGVSRLLTANVDTGKVKVLGEFNVGYQNRGKVLGEEVVFLAYDQGGSHLWKSDGTVEGTIQLTESSVGGGILAATKDRVFYFDFGFQSQGTLWVTDGTPEGTTSVAVLPFATNGADTVHFKSIEDVLYFSFEGETGYFELWRTDGTSAGTTRVTPGNVFLADKPLAIVGNQIFFIATGPPNTTCLWVSDGSTNGTHEVAGIPLTPDDIVAADDRVFFRVETRLWVTDGTTNGTKELGAIESNSVLYPVGNKVFFDTGSIYSPSGDLWASDGTVAGTVRVTEMAVDMLNQITAINGHAYFAGGDALGNGALWKSDGTVAGTTMLEANWAQLDLYNISVVRNVGDTVIFFADDFVHGVEFWRYQEGIPDAVYQNRVNQLDVTGDNEILPSDVLALIDDLNRNGVRDLSEGSTPSRFVDVNGDGIVSPADLLLVIDHLNRRAARFSTRGLWAVATSGPNVLSWSEFSSNEKRVDTDESTQVSVPVSSELFAKIWPQQLHITNGVVEGYRSKIKGWERHREYDPKLANVFDSALESFFGEEIWLDNLN
jgi:ELWxxDGT repeat protein